MRLELGESDVSNTIDSVKKDSLLMEIYEDKGIEAEGQEGRLGGLSV